MVEKLVQVVLERTEAGIGVDGRLIEKYLQVGISGKRSVQFFGIGRKDNGDFIALFRAEQSRYLIVCGVGERSQIPGRASGFFGEYYAEEPGFKGSQPAIRRVDVAKDAWNQECSEQNRQDKAFH